VAASRNAASRTERCGNSGSDDNPMTNALHSPDTSAGQQSYLGTPYSRARQGNFAHSRVPLNEGHRRR
jgi:hypothetical protein